MPRVFDRPVKSHTYGGGCVGGDGGSPGLGGGERGGGGGTIGCGGGGSGTGGGGGNGNDAPMHDALQASMIGVGLLQLYALSLSCPPRAVQYP